MITTIVGMNEYGKTSFLQVLAKTNYFNEDVELKFDTIQDYPRNELVDFENSKDEIEIIKCEYEISKDLLNQIEVEIGKEIFTLQNFTCSYYYNKVPPIISNLSANENKYFNILNSQCLVKNYGNT